MESREVESLESMPQSGHHDLILMRHAPQWHWHSAPHSVSVSASQSQSLSLSLTGRLPLPVAVAARRAPPCTHCHAGVTPHRCRL